MTTWREVYDPISYGEVPRHTFIGRGLNLKGSGNASDNLISYGEEPQRHVPLSAKSPKLEGCWPLLHFKQREEA